MKKVKKVSVTVENLSAKERKFLKSEEKKVSNLKSLSQAKHYVGNAMAMKRGRKQEIVLLATVTIKTIKGKLGMPSGEADYLQKSQDMYQAQKDNTLGFFTVPFDELVQWLGENDAMVAANKEFAKGIKGSEGLKTGALSDIAKTLKLFMAYINKLALLNQKNAIAIIEAALCIVIESGKINKQDFTIKQLKASGSIELISLAGTFDTKRVRTIYEWAYSIDGGKTWEPLNPTLKATTIALEMGIGIETIFRKRTTTTKGGTSKWAVSEPITPK